MTDRSQAALAEVVRHEWGRVVATLVRDLGDLALAEDAVQEAAEAALVSWPTSGLPDRPAAWITTVARRRAIDHLRRDERGKYKAELVGRLEERLADGLDGSAGFEAEEPTVVRDDQLRLLFGCCHPALRVEAQVALTLRSIGGLSTPEIARAFLVPEATVAQRIVRAKRKIASAAIPFNIPPDHELFERLAVVRDVIYLIFNEGYDSSAGVEVVRHDLCEEAIRLARLLASLVRDDAESQGLLALLLLTHARRAARTDRTGDIVLLEQQDRGLWDHEMIDEGTAVLDRAVRLGTPGPRQIEAAISAIHGAAPTPAATDWVEISALYGELVRRSPTPVVRLNHAVAVAMAVGPEAGLGLLADPDLADALERYGYYHAARADLLARSERLAESVAAYDLAIACTESVAEQRLLTRKRDAVGR